jgi:Firmicute plasmid replication protein (RepL)
MPPTSATVHRLRPRTGRQVGLLQGTLDLGGWSESTRVELNERLRTRWTEPERWRFVMVAAQEKLVTAFLRAVREGPRPFATLAVWNAITPFVRPDTGELLCTQRRLARTAGVALGDVSRALARFVEMGALERTARGQYRVSPRLMWKGELAKREEAEKTAPPPRLELV